MTCHCGATLYRSLDGELHCIRCDARTDLCPGCDGRGYRMRGRLMVTCTICGGSKSRAKTGAPTSGSPNTTPREHSIYGASVTMGGSNFPDVERSEIGQQRGSGTKRQGA